jgi:superfamily II DNA/RNA helicase
VVNFDFPKTPIDYMHRTGRTARAGAKGRVTSLVTKRDETMAFQLHQQVSFRHHPGLKKAARKHTQGISKTGS